MDLITTPAPTNYTPPVTRIVHNVAVSLTDRAPTIPVHIVQYDMTMPIVAVSLSANKDAYTVPAGAAVNFRMAKTDGNYIYNPALGVSADGQTVYIAITQQTAAAYGTCQPIVEIVLNGAVAASGAFTLIIDKNPVPESAIESTDEYQTVQQIAAQVQQAADLLEQQSTNLQNLTDNLEAVQNAAANATSAAQSAAQAAQSAQQALGFRTFFDAISPDANGSLDPSRPMTTAAAQASWTVKSKGNRIQSVQANGFTSDGQSGGLNLVKTVISSSNVQSASALTNTVRATLTLPVATGSVKGYCSFLPYVNSYSLDEEHAYTYNNVGYIFIDVSKLETADASGVKAFLDKAIADGAPYTLWYTPSDESQATGLYIPIEIQGHEYRCQCLPITEALGVGDNVQSNVLSGFDRMVKLEVGDFNQYAGDSGVVRIMINPSKLPDIYVPSGNNDYVGAVASNRAPEGSANDTYLGKFSVGMQLASGMVGSVFICVPGLQSIYDYNAWVQESSTLIFYRSTSYTEQNDLSISRETHASGAVYAHQAVELVAVPYTEADVDAAQQLANTPSTLPYIEDADVPMLLDSIGMPEPDVAMQSDGTLDADNTQKAADWIENTAQRLMNVSLASALPVAGTYVVSSQEGTTVLVSLKAMQDGGDAATLGGQTLDQLNDTFLTKEQLLTLIYPVGSIYMSANNVSPQTFLGGTWQQIQGQFLLAASSSYPAGSTGGAAQQTLTSGNLATHNHGPSVGERFLSIGGAANGALVSPGTDVMDVEWNSNWATADTGSGEPFSIMPPYLAVYMWQRTA